MSDALNAAQKKRLAKLADDWAEHVLRELAGGAELGDWKTDLKITVEQGDEAYGYLMDRFADWVFMAGAIIRMRGER